MHLYTCVYEHMYTHTHTQINNMLGIFKSFQQLGLAKELWSFRCLQHASLLLIKESLCVFSFAGPLVVKNNSHLFILFDQGIGKKFFKDMLLNF